MDIEHFKSRFISDYVSFERCIPVLLETLPSDRIAKIYTSSESAVEYYVKHRRLHNHLLGQTVLEYAEMFDDVPHMHFILHAQAGGDVVEVWIEFDSDEDAVLWRLTHD